MERYTDLYAASADAGALSTGLPEPGDTPGAGSSLQDVSPGDIRILPGAALPCTGSAGDVPDPSETGELLLVLADNQERLLDLQGQENLVVAIFFGLTVGILLVKAFWNGGRH